MGHHWVQDLRAREAQRLMETSCVLPLLPTSTNSHYGNNAICFLPLPPPPKTKLSSCRTATPVRTNHLVVQVQIHVRGQAVRDRCPRPTDDCADSTEAVSHADSPAGESLRGGHEDFRIRDGVASMS